MLELVFSNETTARTWPEKFFRNVFEHALKHLAMADKTVELGLYLISQERSQELNRQHRGKDKPTDVLSFPLNERGLEENYAILPLGDIFICPDVAKHQAAELGIQPDQEAARLAVHGLLHLAGYDHELSAAAEKKMIDLQEKILNELFTS